VTTGFRPAVRKAAPLRVVVLGPTKGGKTTTALALAHHLARLLGLPPEKIGLIETEVVGTGEHALPRSEQLVGEPCPCAECMGRGLLLEGHMILPLTDVQHTADHFLNALSQAAAAKFPIVVLDGASPEWDWCLQEVDRRTDIKNATARWAEVTPKHDEFLRALTTYPGHLIVTCRAKDKVGIGDDRKPVELGWQAVQREGFLFEFDHEVWMTTGKGAHARVVARSGTLQGRTWDRPGGELATALLAWARVGESAAAKRAAALEECLKLVAGLPTDEAQKARAWLSQHGGDPTAPGKLLARLKEKATADPTSAAAAPPATSQTPSASSVSKPSPAPGPTSEPAAAASPGPGNGSGTSSAPSSNGTGTGGPDACTTPSQPPATPALSSSASQPGPTSPSPSSTPTPPATAPAGPGGLRRPAPKKAAT
jgi:hypothetical protein